MIAVTGATGQLGALVINELLKTTDAKNIVALVRDPKKAQSLADLNIVVRKADYTQPETLKTALKDVSKLLFISSNEIGQRFSQHKNVVDAAKAVNVELIIYTSILKADTSPLSLAGEHVETEEYIKNSGLDYIILRNGWYTENYTASIVPALTNGAFIGSAKDGKISSAARKDYAEAAAVILSTDDYPSGSIFELAGDDAYTLSELAQVISTEAHKKIPYIDIPEGEFADALKNAGLPEGLALMLANSDVGASKGGLFDDSHILSKIIGRPTTPLKSLVKEAL